MGCPFAGASSAAAAGPCGSWKARARPSSQLRLTDPDRAALKSAARAAIVMPAVFAVAHELIGNPQTSLFAAFGSFAILSSLSILPARSAADSLPT